MGKIMVKGVMYGGGDCANQNLADEFNESSTYAVDDYVIYQDDLYQCTTVVSTAGPWDNTKWTRAQITDVMGGGGTGDVADVYVNGASVLDSNKIAQITNYVELTQAEYDALPASKESDNILYCIKDKATADTTVAPIIYSEEEREVGVWTDGKPLYQKTYYDSYISPSSGPHSTNHDLSGIITQVVPGYIRYEYQGEVYYLIGSQMNSYLQITMPETPSPTYFIATQTVGGVTQTDVYYTVQYIKETDQPGSGKYAPSGVPAVHYSENEQVVGTWVDGSTLYEKTFSEIPLGADGNYNLFSSGIDIAFLVSCYYVENGTGSTYTPSYISRYGASGNCSQSLELNNHSLTLWNQSTKSILWTGTVRYIKTV